MPIPDPTAPPPRTAPTSRTAPPSPITTPEKRRRIILPLHALFVLLSAVLTAAVAVLYPYLAAGSPALTDRARHALTKVAVWGAIALAAVILALIKRRLAPTTTMVLCGLVIALGHLLTTNWRFRVALAGKATHDSLNPPLFVLGLVLMALGVFVRMTKRYGILFWLTPDRRRY